MQIVFGSRITPFGGPFHAERGRLLIFQELIPELDDSRPEDVVCQLFGPIEILEFLADKLGLEYDPEALIRCLLFNGDAGRLLKHILVELPNLEAVNVDDDEVLDKLIEVDGSDGGISQEMIRSPYSSV